MAIEKNERWLNFINLYKNLPELWNVKNDKYKNKTKRAIAYEKLTNEYKNIDNNATVEKVKNRIRNMRFTYTRELKKKISSEKSGAGVDDQYEPNLWYFNEFHFLKEFELAEDGKSTMLCSDDDWVSVTPITTAKEKCTSESYKTNELLSKTIDMKNVDKNKDRNEADIYGVGWAYSYRKLTNSQKIFAKKACDEIFILGQLGKLSLNVVKIETPCSPFLQIVSVQDVTNDQTTTSFIDSPSPQTYHEEETPKSPFVVLVNETDQHQQPESKKRKHTSTDKLEKLPAERLTTPPDTSQQMANIWAHKLSKMNRMQRIIAEKVVNEVMFNGELGLLNTNTGLTNVGSMHETHLSPTHTEPKDEFITIVNNDIFGE